MPSFIYTPKRSITPQHKRFWETGRPVTLQTDAVTNYLPAPEADKTVRRSYSGDAKVITRQRSMCVDLTITDIDQFSGYPVWQEFFDSTICGERFTADLCDLGFYAPVDTTRAFFGDDIPDWSRVNSHTYSVSFTVCFDRMRII